MRSHPRATGLSAVLAVGLLLAACGSDEDESGTSSAASTASTAASTAAASTTEATTDATTATAGTDADTTSPDDTDAASDSTEATGTSSGTAAPAADLSALEDDCAAEGNKVNLIALPDEWANYKGILEAFGEKHPDIDHPVSNPNASSQEELDAVVNLKGADDMPDALDVSPAKAAEATEQGLWEPYQPTTWDQIPDDLKDPEGNWVAAYYGVMAIGTNTTIVDNAPTTWADLKKPEYEGMVALNGDPREAGSAFAAVMAASLANGGSADDIMPGIEFFAELKESGNLIPTEVTQATVISGETPIALDWSYNYPGLVAQIEDAGYEFELNYPSDGVYGGFYAQGVVKDSPHPSCSKLWIEHILSDEGALGYLEGGAMPARFAELEESGAITEDMKGNLPSADILEQVSFLTAEQVEAANATLTEHWGSMVADA